MTKSTCDQQRIHDAVLLIRHGMSWRAVARALKMSRNTVRNIIKEHELTLSRPHTALPTPRALPPRPSKLDPFRARIDALLSKFHDITAQRVFEEIRAADYDGGYTIVKDLVRKIRPKSPPTPSLETPTYDAGEMAESDWASYPIKFTRVPTRELQGFGYVLVYCRRKCYSFHERKDIFALMEGHVRAFERLKGVAHKCKYDGQTPVVLRWEGNQPIYNLHFIEFATYYEFTPEACRPKHPNDKPRVERSFWTAERSFFNGREFRDEADLEAQLVDWMNNVCDHHPQRKRQRRTPLELFELERPALRALPRHPFDTARVVYRLCDISGFISWDGNWYSLPYEHVTEILPLRVTARELFVYAADLTCIARHELRPRGAGLEVVQPGHRPRHAERGPDMELLRGAFLDMGGQAPDFLALLEKAQPRSAGYHARKILALRQEWGTEDVVRALAHAMAYGACEHGAVERILQMRAVPRRLEDYVAKACAQRFDAPLTQSHIEPRDLAAYDNLPCRGSTTTDKETPHAHTPTRHPRGRPKG
jgi:transposase